jgi:tRNA A-37 threonylcarbamoyl transferase component Bud32
MGAGSIGQVFQLEHRVTKRRQAAKVLLSDMASDSQFLRFMREIEVQGRFDHPNIATVHDVLHFKASLILVMELVEGRSLEKLLQEGRLSVRDGINYISQTLSGLEYAHTRGVVHRDVTPGNLIVTPDGRVKLTDFGLAKSLGDYQLTSDGDLVGSLYYMPPEQVRRHSEPDPRSDVYSTGAVLYEILTGKKLFEYTNRLSLMLAQVQEQPIQPLDIEPEIGPELNAIVLKALAKDPEQRYQSAEEFRLALTRAGKTSGFTAVVRSRMRVGTLVLAACAMAGTGGLERNPLKTFVPAAVQPAVAAPVLATVPTPATVPSPAIALGPATSPSPQSKVTLPTKRPRILVAAPIATQAEAVSETSVEPLQAEPEQAEPEQAPIEQAPEAVSEAADEPPQQAPVEKKKHFWSKLNPFRRRKADH